MVRASIIRIALLFIVGVILITVGAWIFISDPTLITFQQFYELIFGQPLSYTILYQTFPLGLIGMGTGIIIIGVFVVFLLDKPPDRFDE